MGKDDHIISSSATKIPWPRRLAAHAAAAVVFCSLIAAIALYLFHYGYHSKSPLAGIGADVFKQSRQPTRQEMLSAIVSKIPLATVSIPTGLQHSIAGIPLSFGLNPLKLTVPLAHPSIMGLRLSAKPVSAESFEDRWEAALHPSTIDALHVATIRLAGQALDPMEEAERVESSRPYVMSMCTDLQGNIWIGTEDGGVQRFNPSAPKFHEWTSFTTKDGLGDDNGYGIACDHRGRIWVGHLNHGVSVFNGKRWQNYDVVGGLSRPDSLSGPLGERVFHIAVCPTDGDVWIATNAGLTRYSDSKDTWSYYTRADGLPADSTDSIAFDKEGNIYVGTQCDGIAMANASDQYKTWRQVRGPAALPTVPVGNGLPTRLINDVFVAHDGTVYAATTTGLAWSTDRGKSWQFVRGKEWADKVRNSATGPPPRWVAKPGAVLAEDFVTCLSEDLHGGIYVGHRRQGLELLERTAGGKTFRVKARFDRNTFVDAIPVPMACGLAGTYGHGMVTVDTPASDLRAKVTNLVQSVSMLPAEATPPNRLDLNQMVATMANMPTLEQIDPLVIPLADDWKTEGDWLGRYGRYWAVISAMESPDDYVWGAGSDVVHYYAQIGPHHIKNDSIRYWVSWLYTRSPKSLELPPVFLDSRVAQGLTTRAMNRRQAEWDDHGEAYSATYEGPDIYCSLDIPDGCFFLSIYAMNKGSATHVNHITDFSRSAYLNWTRDFGISIRNHDDTVGLDDISGFASQPELASGRIISFWNGVYKRYMVLGPTQLTIKISRNYSGNTILEGIMLDAVEEYPSPYFSSENNSKNSSTRGTGSNPVGAAQFEHPSANHLGHFPRNSTEYDAARMVLDDLDALKTSNSTWWALNFRKICVGLARWSQLHITDKSTPTAVALKGSCFYYAGFYLQWEACQMLSAGKTAREIETSLRWNGTLRSSSGLETDIIQDSKLTDKVFVDNSRIGKDINTDIHN